MGKSVWPIGQLFMFELQNNVILNLGNVIFMRKWLNPITKTLKSTSF